MKRRDAPIGWPRYPDCDAPSFAYNTAMRVDVYASNTNRSHILERAKRWWAYALVHGGKEQKRPKEKLNVPTVKVWR